MILSRVKYPKNRVKYRDGNKYLSGQNPNF